MFEDRLSREGREKHAAVRPGHEVPGEDLGRIISLTDGVFAFALTLLVLGLTVPSFTTTGLSNDQVSRHLGNLLQADWQSFLGYVFAFVMIAVWWTYHHRTFRYIERYDTVLMWLNMAILLEIAVMPFVLQVYTSYASTQVAVILFAVMQAATGLTLNVLWRYASSGHRLVDPKLEPAEIRYFANWGLVTPVVFVFSIGVSFLSVEAAEAVWILSIVLRRWGRKYGAA
ncbi:MAG: TMEM175 family protein [Thermoplasmata archaeon]|jgi:TMEM175 potassium channel family protein